MAATSDSPAAAARAAPSTTTSADTTSSTTTTAACTRPPPALPSPNHVDALLAAATPADQLRALRAIKNAVIGNASHKRAYLHHAALLPWLRACLDQADPARPPGSDLLVQAATVVGSLAQGIDEAVPLLAAHDLPTSLVRLLVSSTTSTDAATPLLDAVTRALKLLYAHAHAPKAALNGDAPLAALVALIDRGAAAPPASPAARLAANAASVLSRCCDAPAMQARVVACGAVPALLRLLLMVGKAAPGGRARAHQAALDALGALCRDNRAVAAEVVQMRVNQVPMLAILMTLLRDPSPTMRLLAATCVTNLYRAEVLTDPQVVQELTVTVVPCLVKLFGEPGPTQEGACLVFAILVSDSEPMQQAGADASTIPALVDLVHRTAPSSTTTTSSSTASAQPDTPLGLDGADWYAERTARDRQHEAALLALAAACAQCEPARRLVLESGVVKAVVKALRHSSPGVRAAAGQCTKSLSRSVKSLRTVLVDEGVAEPLCELLTDTNPAVLVTAAAAICNLVLEFAPMKDTIVHHGGIAKLVHLVDWTSATASPAEISAVHVNAVWALKNLVYEAKLETKRAVMAALGYPRLHALMRAPNATVREQALNLVRNLVHGGDADVDDVVTGLGADRVVAAVVTALEDAAPGVAVQALYVVVNLAAGNDAHKDLVMRSDAIMRHVVAALGSPAADVRLGAVWAVINLTWPEESEAGTRVASLRAMGVERRLQEMANDQDAKVVDRVKAALMQMQMTLEL
ncbi:hypothetical protein GGF31_001745 [Allomyces arbusculus]|nr:hypothetical protein GGF31_001745 [Allomyces arbusculus]